MYEERNSQAADWAGTVRLILAVVVVLFGFWIAYIIGGKEWMKWYALIFIPIVGIFTGIYTIMSLLTRRDLGMAQAFGDILHAHSQSGAQMGKMVTELIKGTNAMNKADADVATAMIRQFGSIGQHYEKALAKKQIELIEARQPGMQLEQQQSKYFLPLDDEDGDWEYDDTDYRLPVID